MEMTTIRPILTAKPPDLDENPLVRRMFKRAASSHQDRPESSSAATEFYQSGSYHMGNLIQVSPDRDVASYLKSSAQQIDEKQIARRVFRAIADSLCQKHQAISISPEVLGGEPHVKGLRISIAHVLAHLHHLGSIDAVVAEFKQRISGEQIKAALAYAHDFMEIACDPSADDD